MCDLRKTRYDRLKIFYNNLRNSTNEYYPVYYGGYKLSPPIALSPDKNAYRKYLRVPMSKGNTKQYYVTLFSNVYRLYKESNNFYFINCGVGTPSNIKEYGFGTSMLFSYVAMSIYELILWLTGARNKYRLKISDEVFSPIFNFPQWECDDYDVLLRLTMYPEYHSDNKTINLSIFS